MTLAPIQGRRILPPLRGVGLSPPDNSEPGRIPCFVAGPENELVAAVVKRIVDGINAASGTDSAVDLQELPNPITLAGPSGSGKTHLARGIVDLWHAQRGDDEAVYYTAADFRRELAAAIDDKAVREFRRRVRRRRLLVIDDAHRLSGPSNTAAEFRHTLDAIGERGGRVLLTVEGGLADRTAFERPLLSRLAGGLVLEIAPPGRSARCELLQQAAATAGCTIDNDAIDTLAEHLPAEPPQMLRAAIELRRRGGTHIDVHAAERLLDEQRPATSPPLRDILRVVARYHRVPLRVLTSSSRRQGVVAARAMAIYLARELTPMSYAQIGQLLGGRDHTTIMHNHRRVARELPKDRALQSAIDDLRRLLAPS